MDVAVQGSEPELVAWWGAVTGTLAIVIHVARWWRHDRLAVFIDSLSLDAAAGPVSPVGSRMPSTEIVVRARIANGHGRAVEVDGFGSVGPSGDIHLAEVARQPIAANTGVIIEVPEHILQSQGGRVRPSQFAVRLSDGRVLYTKQRVLLDLDHQCHFGLRLTRTPSAQ